MAIITGLENKRLASAEPVDAKSATAQSVYTAPAATDVFITRVVLRCTAANTISVGATAKVEINPAAGDLFAEEVLVNVLVVDDTWTFTSEARGLVVPAGSTVDVTITNAATGTSQTLSADVWGYYIY